MSESLEAWREGAKLLEAGNSKGARAAFARGLAARPGDTVLAAWDARAMAEGGDLDGAISLSRQILAANPDFGEVRYNLAAYLARKGAIEEAAAELEVALEHVARRPRDVLTDPDFQPHLDDPAFGFLPTSGLVVAVDVPKNAIFWGSQGALTLRITGVDDHAVVVEAPPVAGPIELVGVVQDLMLSTDGNAVDLTWTFKAVGAGSVELGPFSITAGPHHADVRSVQIETTAPEDKARPKEPLEPFVFTTPSRLGDAYGDATAHRIDGGLAVRGMTSDRIEMSPMSASMVQYEVRVGGQPSWMVRLYRDFENLPETVKITRGGDVLFDSAPLSEN